MTTPQRRSRDPFAEREARKYDRPIASRELLIDLLSGHGGPMSFEEIATELGLQEPDLREALRRRLQAMERDGQLIRNRRDGYGVLSKMDLVRGRVIAHRDGYGFLSPDEGGDDLYLPPRQMRSLLHGDRAVVRVSNVDSRGRREAALVEVLERNTQQVVGRFFRESGIGFVEPDNRRIHQDILVPPDKAGSAREGQIVVVEIVEQPSKRARPIGRVVEVLGDHMAPGMEIDIASRSHELPARWPAPALAEADAFDPEVPEAAKRARVDLTHLPLVTIDGADARDFDDAVYCERTARGWKLVVAIADVSAYVDAGTALDEEARLRGNSVYFPGRVIPMLPEALSNGLCSLNPEVDRLCMACEMSVDREGNVTRSRFAEGVMRSRARLTYDAVAGMLVERDEGLRRRHASLLPHLEELYALYRALKAARDRRGTIEFDTTETKIVFGAERKIERIEPLLRNDAHRLIEECMIAANVAAAKFLRRHRIPALFRVHEGPPEEKVTDLRTFLGEFGLRLGGGQRPEPRHYAALLARLEGRPDRRLIETVLLRSLAQAVYSPETSGHFGLALDCYTHFTSPIRRYPDLMVHRAIRHVLRRGARNDFPWNREQLTGLGEHCSMTERRADEATRDAVDWLKCEFMVDRVGEEFDGMVSAVTSFGLFVMLDEIYAEGLVHISALGSDYFHFDPVHHRLTGDRTRRIYRLADRLRVKVMRVNLDERKIDFELVEQGRKQDAAPRRGRRQFGRRRR